jgi:tetratricopeptide (TPR) repeat protein
MGQGSGFLVSEDGLVATNHHVIQNAYFAHVCFPDGSKYPVEGVAASQSSSDLALLKIRGEKFPKLSLGEDALPAVGTKVYAIGNPQGLTNSLSDGLVSGQRQLDDNLTYIQTTPALSDWPEAAIPCFKTAVTLDPNDAASYYLMSVSLRQLRKYDEAIQACRSVIRISGDHAPAYANMGQCYMSLQNYQEAMRALRCRSSHQPRQCCRATQPWNVLRQREAALKGKGALPKCGEA